VAFLGEEDPISKDAARLTPSSANQVWSLISAREMLAANRLAKNHGTRLALQLDGELILRGALSTAVPNKDPVESVTGSDVLRIRLVPFSREQTLSDFHTCVSAGFAELATSAIRCRHGLSRRGRRPRAASC
jgi:hypothetical protein